jgi:biopolymer transport protein ExbD
MALAPLQHDGGDDAVIATINTTPLVDVMLVLLIIFLITIPVVTATIPVQLPRERIDSRETRPETVVVTVDREGHLFWHDTRVADVAALGERLRRSAARKPQPEVQIRGDLDARYDGIGRVLLACQRAGIERVSFVTEPAARER